MSKLTVARKDRKPEAPRTIPLADITITWPEVSGYQSGVTRTRSLSGRVLGRALSEISRASLYNYDADGGDLAFRVSGVAAVLHALAVVDFESVSEDPAAIFYTLGRLLMDDLASERARNFSDTVLKEGIVTISAVPTEQQTAVA